VVMRPDPRVGALTTVRRSRLGPWWLWSIVVILAAGGGYTGYMLRETGAKLARTQAASAILAANRESLQASRVELNQQLAQAKQVETKLRADLARAKSEGDSVATLVGRLQKRVTSQEAELKATRAAAAESKKKADELQAAVAEAKKATEMLEQRLAALKSERDAASADAARAVQEKSALTSKISQLKDELGKMRKAPPEMTGSTPAPTP
jgi:ParB family chromosome partitioning protein